MVIMACGGKDVGKSTFLRCLLNSLLVAYPHGVAYLDCDPGMAPSLIVVVFSSFQYCFILQHTKQVSPSSHCPRACR